MQTSVNPRDVKVLTVWVVLCVACGVGPNSCCKVAAANGEALLFLVADDQVSPLTASVWSLIGEWSACPRSLIGGKWHHLT